MAEELYKQPAESRLYDFVFTNLLAASETITSINAVNQVNLGNVAGSAALTLGTPTFSDNTVQVRISGGTVEESYRLQAIVTTSDSNILELDGILHVREL